MPLSDYSPCELAPRKLSEEEIENPYQVIHDLFSYAHLPQMREHLWDVMKMTVSGNYHKQSRISRSNVLFLYEKLEVLVEAVHIIHQRTKKGSS